MLKLNNARAIALVMIASLAAPACTSEHYGSSTRDLDTETADDEIIGDPTPADFDDAEPIDGEVVEPDEDSCSCEEPAPSECADEAKLQALIAARQKVAAAREAMVKQADATKTALSDLLAQADIKMGSGRKHTVVMTNGKLKRTIAGVPDDVFTAIKAKFTTADQALNGGWVFDTDGSFALANRQFKTQAELDRDVDATNKGAAGLMGVSTYKRDDGYYVQAQGNRVVVYQFENELSNSRYTPPRGLYGDPHFWPDDDARRGDTFAKWLVDHRWKAYVPMGTAVIGTDPARTRDQMIQDAANRAIQDARDASNPFNWETAYELVKIAPILGTIDAIERGDCAEAVASGLTDLATLVGFGPAKLLRLGKLKVPAVMLSMALDGGAVAIRIAYQKDGAWTEALVTAMFQARALKQASKLLITTQRGRALLGAGLATLSIAADKAEKEIDAFVTAEDAYLAAMDELDKARAALQDTLTIPCASDGSDAGDGGGSAVSYDEDEPDVADVCPAAQYEGAYTDALGSAGISLPSAVVDDDSDVADASLALRDGVATFVETVDAMGLAGTDACTLADATDQQPVATPMARMSTPTQPVIAVIAGTATQVTDQTGPLQQQQTTPLPDPAPVVCPAPPSYPSVGDLVTRFKQAHATLLKINRQLRASRDEVDRGLIEGLMARLAIMYGVTTDQIDRLITPTILELKQQAIANKQPWTPGLERDTRLYYLTEVARWAIDGNAFEGMPITATGTQKTALIAKLEGYIADYKKNELSAAQNINWILDKKVFQLAWAIYALPKQEEWMKACTSVTADMFKAAGIVAPSTTPVTIDPVAFAKLVTDLEAQLKTFEAAIDKAKKAILKE